MRAHLDSLSTHAMGAVARIEDDVKVVRMQDVKPTEGTHMERPLEIQQMQLDVLATDVREIASQAQALDALRQAEREREERARRARLGAGKSPTNKTLS